MSESAPLVYEIEKWPTQKGISRKRKGGRWPEPENPENTLMTESERDNGRVNACTIIQRGLGFSASPAELHLLMEALNLRKGVLKSPLIPNDQR